MNGNAPNSERKEEEQVLGENVSSVSHVQDEVFLHSQVETGRQQMDIQVWGKAG